MTIAPASDTDPTPADFRPYRGKVWRLVEAQHRISTNRLAASAEEQALLESLVEDVKPTLPVAARGLHYLLSTPFRYGHSRASRFRRAKERPGIFYGSEHVETAVAETAYWRLLFFSRSPGFVPPSTVVEHSAFTVPVAVDRALDLTCAPFDTQVAHWMDANEYSACQEFAASARTIDAQLIRYASVRQPDHHANIALLDPKGFAALTPAIKQTWHFRYESGRITAFAAFPSSARYSFTFEIFGLSAP
ncbi:RES domain-containing protein (plasmid) [Sphingomonas paeninsulae]|uniref:RES domain-containing protein n=1 Tax=Sphingomonas paeninsulae TaxID=2319844 RepID=A0A494TIK3_SPHPE|nr:RES family NAD+ phosphorylase [Sphingomonas paeninsulae]AYJ84985.1 RES domain-containing protein [Sphingomonas paeninsulae]